MILVSTRLNMKDIELNLIVSVDKEVMDVITAILIQSIIIWSINITILDLQLAAELGNILLEKNKDLEATIKHQQNIIEDQFNEIEVDNVCEKQLINI